MSNIILPDSVSDKIKAEKRANRVTALQFAVELYKNQRNSFGIGDVISDAKSIMSFIEGEENSSQNYGESVE